MAASPLIIPVARFFTISGGAGLAGGKVYTYEAGTNTPKVTYTDHSGSPSSENTNPVILDSTGSANIWLDGNYKINLTDSNNVQQPNYPVDNVSSSTGGNNFYITTGVANNYILTPAPALLQYSDGDSFFVQFNVANTGPSTINVSNLGAKDLVKGAAAPLRLGDLLTDVVYEIVYNGTAFQVLNPSVPSNIFIQMGFQATAPSGFLSMNGNTIAKTSGATFNGNQYSDLYAYLWNNCSDAVAPVSTGRGASAAADFAANKNITLPDRRDYSPFGVSGAGSITAAGVTAGATTVSAAGSVSGSITIDAVTLSVSNMPAHQHDTMVNNSGAPYGNGAVVSGGNVGAPSTEPASLTSSKGSGTSFTPTGSLSASFSGTPTSVLHKVFGVYYYINY